MNLLFFILYDIVFVTLSIWYIPFCVIKGKFSFRAFLEKMSFIPLLSGEKSIWVQAVSVGEVLAVRELLHRVKELFNYRIVISTTTLTGRAVADKIYGSWAEVVFFPFDITYVLKRVIRIINPKLFIAVETEIWPNLFRTLSRKNIPIVILNGRISDKAYYKYRRFKVVTKRVLSMCSCIGAQNDYYRQRFLSIGAPPSKVYISGNVKFGSFEVKENELSVFREKYIKVLKRNSDYLFIAASTHGPEEKIVIDVFKDLASRFSIRLLIAPRHPERVKEVEKEVLRCGFKPVMISSIRKDTLNIDSDSVFILDTVGELFYFYSLCDICFVGGSLVDYGGHNILEPVYFKKATIFGPYMDNFKEIEKVVLENDAAIRVENKDELKYYAEKIISDSVFRKKLADNASGVFKQQKQVLEKNIDVIAGYLH